MNIHYKNYPTDYVDRLQNQGKRHKARCFWEYYNDVQNKAVNSFSFYAKSWGYKGNGTVTDWVKEFRDEIQKFYDAHILMNNEHYSSVKKQSGRQPDDKRTKKTQQEPTVSGVDKTERTATGQQPEQVLNIDNNNTRVRGLYDGFYFLYRQFNKYAGNKLDGVDSFVNVSDVDHKRLSVASMFYLKDDTVDKKVGVKKFLDNSIYLNYMEMYLSVAVDGEWLDGVYDTEREVFTTFITKTEYKLTANKIADKLAKSEILFLKDAA